MKVLVYLEGKSDVDCMKTLFGSIAAEREKQGVKISFHLLKIRGKTQTGKASLINKGVGKAATILASDPDARVALVPDLYPKDQGGLHKTPEELFELIETKFRTEIENKKLSPREQELSSRFVSFCFKHDLEALLLAVPDRLAGRLGVNQDSFQGKWKEPVEDQNHDDPPKKVVERLFKDHKKKYHPIVDAPAILDGVSPSDLSESCPQCFKPLAEFIAQCDGRA